MNEARRLFAKFRSGTFRKIEVCSGTTSRPLVSILALYGRAMISATNAEESFEHGFENSASADYQQGKQDHETLCEPALTQLS